MKIAYLLPRIDNKSSITVFKSVIENLSKDSSVFIEVYYFDEKISLDLNYPAQRIKFRSNILIKGDFDIIHTSGIRPNLWVWLNKRKFNYKTKFVTTIHSYIYDDLKNSYGRLFAYFFAKFWFLILQSQDEVVVLTETAKKYYTDKIKSKISIINNGVGLPKKSILSISDKEFFQNIRQKYKLILGTHAVVSKIKSLDTIIRGLPLIPESCFVIVGDGIELDNLKKLSLELGLEERVFFLGFKSNIYSFFNYYDIYVMPSISEGMPIALLEAVSSKTLCLTSNITTFNELFLDSEVVKFEVKNVNSFVDAITNFDTNSRNTFINKAYIRYENNYTDSVMSLNYHKLYQNLIKYE